VALFREARKGMSLNGQMGEASIFEEADVADEQPI
jgi:hypothetical protein